jgi:ABC-type nitrate/sulfonate/bicarbonate transport system substrate-binding protein
MRRDPGLLRRFAPRNDGRYWAIAALFSLALCGSPPARAADQVHAAKAAGVAWTFTLLNVGIEQGIFAKYGLDVDTSDMAGDARLQQALASGAVDFGLGSGPSMALAAKGGQAIAVAAFAGEPRNIAIIVGKDSPIKTVADLKGKKMGTTTKGSLTEWLVQQLSRQQGWGDDGIPMVELGTFDASLAALKVKQIDAMVGALEAGYLLEEKGDAKVLTGLEKVAPKFHTHVVFARDDLIKSNPDLVSRFLKGVFASIAFMKANKEKTSDIATQVLHQTPAVMNRAWDYEISMFEDDGHFDPQAIDVLQQSFVAMGLAPEKIPDDKLYTTQFLPVKP